jgi:DNA-binding NtrC family response regulator
VIQLLTAPAALLPGTPRAADDVTTILVVEDQAPLRMLLKLALHRRGYAVIEAESFAEASRLWQENAGLVNLAIIDRRLGEGSDGCELATRIHSMDPAVGIIITTGESICDLPVNPNIFAVLQKPFGTGKLYEATRAVLTASAVGRSN